MNKMKFESTGTPLETRCEKCGHVLRIVNGHFCANCGRRPYMNKDEPKIPESPSEVPCTSAAHVKAAKPIIITLLYLMGFLAALAIVGGIAGIVWDANSPSELNLFGAKIKTGHVGVAFTSIGLISMVAVVRSVLKHVHKLAELPD